MAKIDKMDTLLCSLSRKKRRHEVFLTELRVGRHYYRSYRYSKGGKLIIRPTIYTKRMNYLTDTTTKDHQSIKNIELVSN